MGGDNWGYGLVFFFLLIVLLLVIGILAVCLWCLLLILRQYLDLMKKEDVVGKETKDTEERENKESETKMPMPIQPVLPQTELKEREGEEPSGGTGDKINCDMILKSEQNLEKNHQELHKDIRIRVLEFIRLSSKNNCVRLKVINKSFSGYLENYELVEDPDGKLLMIQGKSGECIVVPESENIGEKEYEYSGVKGCYETNIPVRSGCYYQIIQILELCTVQKHEDKYIIQSKGKLMLEQK